MKRETIVEAAARRRVLPEVVRHALRVFGVYVWGASDRTPPRYPAAVVTAALRFARTRGVAPERARCEAVAFGRRCSAAALDGLATGDGAPACAAHGREPEPEVQTLLTHALRPLARRGGALPWPGMAARRRKR